MRRTIVLLALLLSACAERVTAVYSDDVADAGRVAEGDGGRFLGPDAGAPAVDLSGFRDAATNVEGDATVVDAVVGDAAVDAGPCYPPEGLESGLYNLQCDACPAAGCLPIIWKAALGTGTADGMPGISSVLATLETDLYSYTHRFDVGEDASAVVIESGELFDHLYQGLPLRLRHELVLTREPWSESDEGLQVPGNTAVPSYLRAVAQVSASSALVTWTMHRAPD